MMLADRFEGIVHAPTQSGTNGFDLTVAAVHDVTGAGRVDFGGDELEPAETEPREPETRDPDDDHGWWYLESGRYLLEHNEALTGDGPPLTVQPRRELVERGASHPTLTVTALPRLPLAVGGAGIRLKENARVSTAVEAG